MKYDSGCGITKEELTVEEESRIEALMVEGYSYVNAYRAVVLGHDPMESEDDNRLDHRLSIDALPGYDAWKTSSGREGTE